MSNIETKPASQAPAPPAPSQDDAVDPEYVADCADRAAQIASGVERDVEELRDLVSELEDEGVDVPDSLEEVVNRLYETAHEAVYEARELAATLQELADAADEEEDDAEDDDDDERIERVTDKAAFENNVGNGEV